MTCWAGSSVSSAEETMNDASFSSSSIVGSVLTSASNFSSGMSGRTFLPSGPTTSTLSSVTASPAGAFAADFVAALAGALVAGAFAAAALAVGACFPAAALVAGLVFVAAFLAGAFAVVFAWLVVVFLRAVEDTNTSRQGHMGAARPGMVKSRSGHSAMDLVASTKRRPPWRSPSGIAATSGSAGGRCGLGRSLLLLLEVADLLQRRRVDHVGDRALALERVVADGPLPAIRAYVELLGDQGSEDLSLLLAEPGQPHHALEQVGAGDRLGPDPLGVTVVPFDHEPRESLEPLGHRTREPVDRRRRGAQRLELRRIRRRDRRGIEAAEPVEPLGRPTEGVLHGVLLVEHHADQQRERAVGEHLVCVRVAGDLDGHPLILPDDARPGRARPGPPPAPLRADPPAPAGPAGRWAVSGRRAPRAPGRRRCLPGTGRRRGPRPEGTARR